MHCTQRLARQHFWEGDEVFEKEILQSQEDGRTWAVRAPMRGQTFFKESHGVLSEMFGRDAGAYGKRSLDFSLRSSFDRDHDASHVLLRR